MNASTDNEINARLIDLSRTVSSMLDTATTPNDVTVMRDKMLHAVAESADAARARIAQQPSVN